MKRPFWHRLDLLARHVVPVSLAFVLVLLSIVPLRVPLLNLVFPALALVSIYYWTLYRPDLMPPAAAFAIGLADDVLSGAPLGVNALVFVLVHAAVNTQRGFFLGKSFAIVWLGFALLAGAAFTIAWLVVSAFYGLLVNGTGALLQAGATIGCLPLIWRLLVQCHLRVVGQA